MIPEQHARRRAPSSQIVSEFYYRRRRFIDNLNLAADFLGVGKERVLLAEIARRSAPTEPFAWTVLGTQEEWATAWGMSERTLKRHLSALRAAGLLTGEVRPSKAVRGRRQRGFEHPVLSIPEQVVEEVARWSEPGFWPTLRKCQNGTYSLGGNDLPNLAETAQMPATATAGSTDVTGVTSPPISNSSSNNEIPTNGVGRRLRRRERTSMRKWDDDGYDPPMIGADPDRPKSSDAKTSPTVEADRLFDVEWAAMLRQYPSLSMRLPGHPWNAGPKVAYRAWLKKEFLPALDGDLDRAARVFRAFCADLASGREFLPGDMPGFRRLHVRTSQYLIKVARSVTPEDDEPVPFRHQSQRTARRRPPSGRPEIVTEHFPD